MLVMYVYFKIRTTNVEGIFGLGAEFVNPIVD